MLGHLLGSALDFFSSSVFLRATRPTCEASICRAWVPGEIRLLRLVHAITKSSGWNNPRFCRA